MTQHRPGQGTGSGEATQETCVKILPAEQTCGAESVKGHRKLSKASQYKKLLGLLVKQEAAQESSPSVPVWLS